MLHIGGLDLTNVVSFKEVSVDFKSTLTYVRGVNKDSDLARPTGNGTGKSLFFSTIPNLVYSAAPLSLKKKSRKDMLSQKGSAIGMILKPGDDQPEYEIIQMPNKYVIYENGIDLEVNTIPRAEAKIRELFPISEIEFYSRCYLSTQRPYRLLRDSDSERLQHIVDIARLDQYSNIHKFFSLKAGEIKDNEIRLSVLEQQLASVRKKLRETKSSLTPADYKKRKVEYKKAAASLEQLQKAKFQLLSKQQALDSLVTVETELDTLRSRYTFKKAPAAQLALLRADKKAANAWQTYTDQLAHIKKVQVKISESIRAIEEQLPADSSKSKLKADLKAYKLELKATTAKVAEEENAKEAYEELSAELEEVQTSFSALNLAANQIDKNTDYAALIAEHKVSLRLESLLEHEDEDEASSGTCPTCQSDIDFEAIRTVVETAKKAVAKYTRYKRAKEYLSQIAPLQKKLRAISFDEAALAAAVALEKSLGKRIAAAEQNLALYGELASLHEQYDALDKPTAPKAEKPKLSLDDIEEGIDLCHEIEKHLKAKSAILENHPHFAHFRSAKAVSKENASVLAEIETLEKQIRSVESKQADCAGEISAYEQYTNTVNVYKGEEKSALAEIEKLKPGVADKKLVTILTKAYGTKGLRAYAANAFCQLYQTNLNHYRDLIFAEPFEFFVEASDTGVSIMVDRNNGKANSKSDVRHLSGAESECFALLSAASLITLTPDNRKLNMIVLDEPTSHMHPVTRELFNQKFIPFLRELVPSIFIITPNDDDTGPNSEEWVVEKSKGVSRLIQM